MLRINIDTKDQVLVNLEKVKLKENSPPSEEPTEGKRKQLQQRLSPPLLGLPAPPPRHWNLLHSRTERCSAALNAGTPP